MIHRIIAFSVSNKLLITLLVLILIAGGVYSLRNIAVNTVPDISGNQVRIITVTPDLATQEVEQYVTFPVEMEMANLPGVEGVRSVSKFGLSVVTVVFSNDMDIYLARQLVSEKINVAKEEIPDGYGKPEMGPIMSGLGEIYQYVVDTRPGYDSVYSAMELRTIQDWIIRRQLSGIDGVVEINSWGGYMKQYEVSVNADRLKSMDITIGDVFKALEQNNSNAGGSYIQKNDNAYFIRGEGLVRSLDDIRNIRIKSNEGFPVKIGDVAKVRFGHATRLGAFTYNGKGEAVAGQVMMLKGENSAQVIRNVKKRMEHVRKSLPEGVVIEPYIDRSELIERTSGTVVENLTIGGLIVIFILILFLGDWRSGLIVASVIPLSMLFALSMMQLFGITANLMSMGAIDFGIIIDGAVIIVEFVVYQLYIKRDGLLHLQGHALRGQINDITITASSRMMRTAFFGQIIILIVFVPVLSLTGVAGKMFRPMAMTFGFALIGAMLLCLTYVPMIASYLLKPGKAGSRRISEGIMNTLKRIYRPLLLFVLRFKGWVLGGSVLALGLTIWIFMRMGSVFMPQLDEGSFAIHPILKSGTSLKQTIETTTNLEKILLKEFPEVEQVASRIGTGEVPADPMSLEMSDMIVDLKPQSEWESAQTKDELARKMKEEMSTVPGVNFVFSQPIEMLFKHFMTGVNADIAIKIFGDNLDVLYDKGVETRKLIEDIEGVSGIRVEKVTGLPQINIKYKRDKIAEYGLDIARVNRAVTTAFSGNAAGTVYEGEKRFDLVVRLDTASRKDITDIQNLYVQMDDGGQVPLKTFADIGYKTGPAQISRENIRRRAVVAVNTAERDVTSVLEDIKSQVQHLDLPSGYNIRYEGDFQNLQKARKRLMLVVPAAMVLIIILLYFTFNSLIQSIMVFTAVPLAAIGGVLALWLRDMPFSISAAVGFIALSGIAVLNGIVLLSYFNELKQEGIGNINRRIIKGTSQRIRPVMLTALTDMLGFLPMAVSSSPGAEVQRPLATVVLGGLVTASLLTLLVLPVIYALAEKSKPVRGLSGQRFVLLILAACLLPAFSSGLKAQHAQEDDTLKLDMPQAIDMAIENNPGLLAGEMQIKQHQTLKKASIDLDKTRLFYGRAEYNRPENTGIKMIGISQQFDFPLQYKANRNISNENIQLAKNRYRQKKQTLTANVKKRFTDILFHKARLRLYKKLDSTFSGFEKAATLRHETGEINLLEKLSARDKYQQIGLQKKEALTQLDKAYQALSRLLNTDKSINVEQARLEPIRIHVNEDTAIIAQNPQLQSEKQKIELADARWQKARANMYPDLYLRYAEQEIKEQRNFYQAQIGLMIPLAFWNYKSRKEAAYVKKSAQEAAYQDAVNHIRTLYKQNSETYRLQKQKLSFFKNKRLKTAEKLLTNARKQYQKGAIDYVAFVQYIDQAIEIKIKYLELVREFNHTVIDLQLLRGNLN